MQSAGLKEARSCSNLNRWAETVNVESQSFESKGKLMQQSKDTGKRILSNSNASSFHDKVRSILESLNINLNE